MIINNDCLDEMRKMDDNSISCVVTDPPYGLKFMGKGWDHAVPGVEYWRECFRIAKPGTFMLAFGGTRTYHRLTCAIEDAGWEIRDCLMWIFGSGFPKSHNNFGIEGYGTALKPAYEPIIMAMKPCDGTFKENDEKWGQAGINIDACRIGNEILPAQARGISKIGTFEDADGNITPERKGRWPANVLFDEFNEPVLILKDSLPNDIISVIQEYYCDYKLPGLSKDDRNLSKSSKKEKGSVLQSNVLLSGSKRKDEKREASDVGEKTQGGICSENENEQEGLEGESQSQVSGLLVQSGLSPHQPSGIDRGTARFSETDDKTSRDSGTSNNNGYVAESISFAIGNCSSSQWSQGRQQNKELGDDGQLDSQNGTQGDSERAPSIEIRERALKVLACDIPERWLKYFLETGEEVRSPHCAARMLDEQSGELKSGSLSKINHKPIDLVYEHGRKLANINEFKANSGGASRFFYCAKTSSKERNAGLEGMETKEAGFKNDSGRGIQRGDAYTQVTYKNKHPTVKPLKLMRYLITLVMPPKDGVLLDPFAGSGSTIVAAHQLGLKAIGIEKSAEYCEIARKRLENVQIMPKEIDPQLDFLEGTNGG